MLRVLDEHGRTRGTIMLDESLWDDDREWTYADAIVEQLGGGRRLELLSGGRAE